MPMPWEKYGNPFETALQSEGVSGPLADFARSIYQQESGGGKNAKTSNQGAVGGMQIVPSTFATVADKGWNISDPVQNARAGIRYAKQMFERAKGDPKIAAAGYYGGPGGLDKASRGVAVSDPKNPNAPNTLQYGQQVASRMSDSSVTGGAPWEKYKPAEQAPVATSKPEIKPPTTQPFSPIDAIKRGFKGVGEAAAATATGMIAKPVADVAGLAALGREVVSPTGGDPEAFRQHIQQQLTYAPKTPEGRAMAEYNPMALIGKGVGYVGEKVGNLVGGGAPASSVRGMLGNAAQEATVQAPGLIGGKFGSSSRETLPAKQAALDITKGENLPRDTIRGQSQSAGLVTPVEGTSWITGIPGIGKVDKWISQKNEPKFNRLVADNFGIPKGVALTPEELKGVRQQHGNAYRAIISAGDEMKTPVSAPSAIVDVSGKPMVSSSAKGGFQTTPQFNAKIKDTLNSIAAEQAEFPETFRSLDASTKLLTDYADKKTFTPATTIRAIRQLRKDATTEFKSDDPAKLASAFTRKEIANNLEDMIESNLGRTGQTKLLKDYRDARKAIAQSYDVESALDNTGNVNARKLYLISQKKPLTGNLKLVADYAGAFPEGAQRVASGRQAISPWDFMIGGGGMGVGMPLAGAGLVAGRVAVPYLAERGMLQKKTPNYQATGVGSNVLPPLGFATTSEASKRKLLSPPQ